MFFPVHFSIVVLRKLIWLNPQVPKIKHQTSRMGQATVLTSVLIGFLGVTPRAFSLTVAVSTLGVKSLVESWVGSAALGSI